jgi:hypothetical protein
MRSPGNHWTTRDVYDRHRHVAGRNCADDGGVQLSKRIVGECGKSTDRQSGRQKRFRRIRGLCRNRYCTLHTGFARAIQQKKKARRDETHLTVRLSMWDFRQGACSASFPGVTLQRSSCQPLSVFVIAILPLNVSSSLSAYRSTDSFPLKKLSSNDELTFGHV